MDRRKTREVRIGKVIIGGNNPIAVQSMCTTRTSDVKETIGQIKRLQNAGCEIVRVSVFDSKDASCLGYIKSRIAIPLVADIHFNYKLALEAIDQGVDKIRINPGNIRGFEKVKMVVERANQKGISIRLGVNSGSVERDLLNKYGWPCPGAMVESALRHVEFCEKLGFKDIVVSLKSTDIRTSLENYRLFSKRSDYPLHLGITEAGTPGYGSLKSAIGIGALLLEGIGDTIRVSLVGNPVEEVKVAYDVLKATGARIRDPEIIACPTCGRIAIDLEKVVNQVKRRIKDIKVPLKVAILGCAVNGPGEAREADIGVAGGKGEALIFRHGEIIKKVKEENLVDALVEEIRKMTQQKE